jgi:hypothetical protein
MPGTWAGGPMRASAAGNRRLRRAALKARLNATRRTHASGSSYSDTWRQRTAARAKASERGVGQVPGHPEELDDQRPVGRGVERLEAPLLDHQRAGFTIGGANHRICASFRGGAPLSPCARDTPHRPRPIPLPADVTGS